MIFGKERKKQKQNIEVSKIFNFGNFKRYITQIIFLIKVNIYVKFDDKDFSLFIFDFVKWASIASIDALVEIITGRNNIQMSLENI